MLLWLAALVFSASDETRITENFTGKVLDSGTADGRLLRVERLDVPKRSPLAIVTMKGCGPLETGSSHEFLTWSGASEPALACLAVDGRPHVPELPHGFGVVVGRVFELRDDASARTVAGIALKATCGGRVFAGRADSRGRFWTMLPAGHCVLEVASDRLRTSGVSGVLVREGEAGVAGIRVRPLGLLERLEEWAGSVRSMFAAN